MVYAGAMRELLPAPTSALDTRGLPRVGSFRGSLGRVDLSRAAGNVRRALRHKRWLYVALATDDTWISFAVVRLGYASNMFALAWHRGARALAADASAIAPPFAATVGDTAGEGCCADFRAGRMSCSVRRERGRETYAVTLRAPELVLDATLDAAPAPPALAAIASLGPGLPSTTEKRPLLAARGEAVIAGVRKRLDGALAGYDFTSGLLPRRTSWRWGFALGRTRDGEPIALNLVQGFVGEAECAAWARGEPHPLAEARFDRDGDTTRVASGSRGASRADLTFRAGASHAERRDLRIVRTNFEQSVGIWSGEIDLEPLDKPLRIDEVLGVVEDQDVTW